MPGLFSSIYDFPADPTLWEALEPHRTRRDPNHPFWKFWTPPVLFTQQLFRRRVDPVVHLWVGVVNERWVCDSADEYDDAAIR